MTRMLAMSAILIGIMGGTGCMIVDTPVMGVLGSRVRWGEFAQGDDKGHKEGKACMDTILGLVARGDASVRAANRPAGSPRSPCGSLREELPEHRGRVLHDRPGNLTAPPILSEPHAGVPDSPTFGIG